MSRLPLYIAPSRRVALLIKFQWQGGSAHYTSFDSNLVVGGTTYSSQVRMAVEAAEADGSATDKPWMVTLPKVAPLSNMTRSCPHPDVTCTISEVDPDTSPPTAVVVFSGRITVVTANPKGMAGMIQAEIAGWRALIQYPLGLEARAGCASIFGESPCCFDIASKRVQATIESVGPYSVIASSVPSSPPGRRAYWEAGSVEVDGLAVMIRGRSGSEFRLQKNPPAEWAGRVAVFSPGCLKSIEDCRAWGNEERFLGVGVAIPAYNPELEDPGVG